MIVPIPDRIPLSDKGAVYVTMTWTFKQLNLFVLQETRSCDWPPCSCLLWFGYRWWSWSPKVSTNMGTACCCWICFQSCNAAPVSSAWWSVSITSYKASLKAHRAGNILLEEVEGSVASVLHEQVRDFSSSAIALICCLHVQQLLPIISSVQLHQILKALLCAVPVTSVEDLACLYQTCHVLRTKQHRPFSLNHFIKGANKVNNSNHAFGCCESWLG